MVQYKDKYNNRNSNRYKITSALSFRAQRRISQNTEIIRLVPLARDDIREPTERLPYNFYIIYFFGMDTRRAQDGNPPLQYLFKGCRNLYGTIPTSYHNRRFVNRPYEIKTKIKMQGMHLYITKTPHIWNESILYNIC